MSELEQRVRDLVAMWRRQSSSYEAQANRMGEVLVAPCHVTASVTVDMCAKELEKVIDGLPVQMLERESAEA